MIKDVQIGDAGKKGQGVFALKNFKKGTFVFRSLRGKIVHKKDSPKLTMDDRMHLNEIDYNTWEIMRSPGRFMNHSCDPNTIQKGLSYIAIKNIKAGEEVTGEYRINAFDKNRWRCYCGSKNCKKWLRSDFFDIDSKLQKKYLPFAPRFIQEEYKKRNLKS